MLLLMKYMKIMEESIDAAKVHGKGKDSVDAGRENGGGPEAGICRNRTYSGRAFKGRDGSRRKSARGERSRGKAAFGNDPGTDYAGYRSACKR